MNSSSAREVRRSRVLAFDPPASLAVLAVVVVALPGEQSFWFGAATHE